MLADTGPVREHLDAEPLRENQLEAADRVGADLCHAQGAGLVSGPELSDPRIEDTCAGCSPVKRLKGVWIGSGVIDIRCCGYSSAFGVQSERTLDMQCMTGRPTVWRPSGWREDSFAKAHPDHVSGSAQIHEGLSDQRCEGGDHEPAKAAGAPRAKDVRLFHDDVEGGTRSTTSGEVPIPAEPVASAGRSWPPKRL